MLQKLHTAALTLFCGFFFVIEYISIYFLDLIVRYSFSNCEILLKKWTLNYVDSPYSVLYMQ